MRSVQPPDDIKSLLRDFQGMAGVIEYDLFASDADTVVDMEAHRRAVLRAYERWDAEFREQGRRNLRRIQTDPEFKDVYPPAKNRVFEQQCLRAVEHGLEAAPEKLTSQSITPYRFLGKSFKMGWLPAPHGEKLRALRPELLDMYAELKRLNADVQPDPSYSLGSASFDNAYAYAFSDPPYGLQSADGNTPLQVFRGLNHAAFHDFAPGVAIYAWTTDWCRHFESGNEWWGSFLWTVYNPARNLVIVLSASTTD